MDTRMLGSEGLPVSAVGLGCMGLSQAYGPADDTESITTLQRALDVGVTFWDTAQSYGAGHNERLLAHALRGRRDDVVLATKFGIVREADGTVGLDGRPERARGYTPLAQGEDVVPIPGTRRPARVEESAATADVALSSADVERLEGLAPRAAWSGDRQSFAAHRTTRAPS